MKNTLRFMFLIKFLIVILIYGCEKGKQKEQLSVDKEEKMTVNNLDTNKSNNLPVERIVVNDDPNCVEFVALWSAGDIAEKIGKDKKWVFLNYTVDMWDAPPTYSSGNMVGKLRASSYARIMAIMGDDYKVESPINQTQGWISNDHVKTISKKNPKTRALCE